MRTEAMRKAMAVMLVMALILAIRATQSTPARADVADESLCVVTHVDVMPKFTAEGRELLRAFVTETRTDAGLVRVEAFEELSRPNHSTVIEVWKDRKSYDDHLSADHTRAYRGKLQPMLGSPFDERLHRPVR